MGDEGVNEPREDKRREGRGIYRITSIGACLIKGYHGDIPHLSPSYLSLPSPCDSPSSPSPPTLSITVL